MNRFFDTNNSEFESDTEFLIRPNPCHFSFRSFADGGSI